MHPVGKKMTVEQYLAESETWEVRHEWVYGEAWAMSGGSAVHAAVSANVLVGLALRLRGRPCRAVGSDQRVHVPDLDGYLYPDVTVVCGKYRFAEDDSHTVTNPTVIVEVLSPSTRNYDLGAKQEHYLRITSLQHLLFIDPETRSVRQYRRVEGGWFLDLLTEGELNLGAIDVSLPIAELFADLENVGEGA